MKRLLLVEDDRALAVGLTDAFAQEGFVVSVARDGVKAQELLHGPAGAGADRRAAGDPPFDVVVLDLMLPGRSGLDVLRELRARGDPTPVLILTARGSEADKVLGLELGADDYVTKPFSPRELVARVRALLRREDLHAAAAGRADDGARGAAPQPEWPAPFRLGDAEVDLAAFEIRRGGAAHPLSRKEASVLALLWSQRGRAVTREQFLRQVWDGGEHVGTRTIDMHVLNLRQKLEPDPAAPRHLLTVHGVGYRLVAE
jgi:DNA-binding response OmpR family regulator